MKTLVLGGVRSGKLFLSSLLATAVLTGSPAGTACAAGPIAVRDSARQELRLAQSPRRVITLLPSLTETICALGECARLVATDRYSNWPPGVKDLPKTGGLDDAQIELIVSLKPDVVIVSHASRVADRLRSLGIATFDVKAETYADVFHTVTVLGQLLGVPEKAAALNRHIEQSVDAVVEAARVSLHGRSPSVYYEVDDGPFAAGPNSFIGELLARLGTRNILTPDLGSFPKLNPEYIVRHDPDVIFTSTNAAGTLESRPGWGRIRAVREKRLCSFTPQVRDTIVRPGPRVVDGLRSIAQCLSRVAP